MAIELEQNGSGLLALASALGLAGRRLALKRCERIVGSDSVPFGPSTLPERSK
jgi:hypothetical protein